MTRCCARCGRPLFDDPFNDWKDKVVTCQPSCEGLKDAMREVREMFNNMIIKSKDEDE